jgi:glutathione S-transferase
VPRAWAHFGVQMTDERKKALEQKRQLGYAALGVMEGHLRSNDFFVANRYSIADIALYAYTHVADEGASTSAASPPSAPGWSSSGSSRGKYP